MKKWIPIVVLAVCALGSAIWMAHLAIGLGKEPVGVVALAVVGAVSGAGFALLAAMPVVVVARVLGKGPEPLRIAEGERAIAEIPANHFLGIEARGGKLVVTTKRLLFRPHRFNVQLAAVAIELSRVDAVKPWLSGVRVASRGRKDRFVVSRPSRVAELLAELVRTPEESRGALADELRGLPGAKLLPNEAASVDDR